MQTIIDVYKMAYNQEDGKYVYELNRFGDRVCCTITLDCPPDKEQTDCLLRCRLRKLQRKNNGGVGYEASGNRLSFPEKVTGNKGEVDLDSIRAVICSECLKKYKISLREQRVYG